MRLLIIAAIACVCLRAMAFADLPPVTVHRSDKIVEPDFICITLAPSWTSVPACIDLSRLPGHRR